jgi:hypothetical protein
MGAAVRDHRNAVRDRSESLSAINRNTCPQSPESAPAHMVLRDAIKSTTDMIRYGERQKLIGALGTAVLVGWLLERVRSRQVVES